MRVIRDNKGHARKGGALVKVVIGLVVMCGVSLTLAWVWHGLERSDQTAAQQPVAGEPVAAEAVGESVEEAVGTEAGAGVQPEPEAAVPFRDQFPNAVPEGARVDDSYFDDAIFIGDSISTGIPLYRVMPGADVVAYTGVNILTMLDSKQVETADGRELTLLEAAAEKGEKGKVYLLLGGNSLDFHMDAWVAGYREFLQAVKAQYPGAAIYVQSMTPVTESEICQKLYPNSTNERLEEYNLALYNLAMEQGVYFVDIAAALMDDQGRLPEEASPTDGVHFTAEYYHKWFDYLRTHTVGGDGV